MKIALAQLNYHIGNFENNYFRIRQAMQEAKRQQADLVVFAELAVCGYPPRDFLEFKDFINRCLEIVQKLAQDTASIGIAVIIGAPARNPVLEGKDLFNTAYFLSNGKIQTEVHKTLLPNYDVFDEYRYFEPGLNTELILFKGIKIALTICEDLWNLGNENPLYTTCPMDALAAQSPDLMINISASPFHYSQLVDRIEVLKANAKAYHLPILYVNHVGAQTELIFDGGSLVMDAKGNVLDEFPYFEEEIRIYNTNQLQEANHSSGQRQNKEKPKLIHDALVLGIRDYFGKLGFSDAILGLSGGIDSAVCLALATEALGASHVHAIMMPSAFSSEHSVSDSEKLIINLNIAHQIIPINEVYEKVLQTLKPFFKNKAFDVTEENLQARLRAVYLMALSNKLGYILLNTSNKSEAAVGYGTLYGDMSGGLSVIGDIYKTEVYELAGYINREKIIIPKNIITKAPSAELRPHQTDQDSLPPYDQLDPVLYAYIEQQKGPKEIEAMGFDSQLVQSVLKMVNQNEYKRFQTAPVLRVSTKAFGMGRRMPIVAKYLS